MIRPRPLAVLVAALRTSVAEAGSGATRAQRRPLTSPALSMTSRPLSPTISTSILMLVGVFLLPPMKKPLTPFSKAM